MDQNDTKEDPTPQSRTRYEVAPERFVEVWQTANSAEEVADILSMPKPIVHARASAYRRQGIKLKKMPRCPKNRLDVEALNRRIEELTSQQQDDGAVE